MSTFWNRFASNVLELNYNWFECIKQLEHHLDWNICLEKVKELSLPTELNKNFT